MLEITNTASGASYSPKQWFRLMWGLLHSHPSEVPQHQRAALNLFLGTHLVLAWYFAGIVSLLLFVLIY